MASPKSSTPNAAPNGNSARTKAALPEGFQSVTMDCPFYDGEATKLPLRGYLIDCVAMPLTKEGKPWNAYVILATVATQAVTRDGELIAVAEGDRVAIGGSAALDGLEGVARDRNYVREVFIADNGKVGIGGGKTFRDFTIGMTPTAHKRMAPTLGGASHVQLPEASAPVPQLNGQAASGRGEVVPAAS